MRLLVIEDEAHLRTALLESLGRAGYAVDSADNGKDGLHLGLENPYDLAIIDLGLPQVSGLDVIRQLRQCECSYPILILTARSDWQDKVEGLEAGADDYVVKPFHFEEVNARVNALLRRSMGRAKAALNFGPLHIDTTAKTASLNQQLMTLTSYEYNTLEYLALKAGNIVSKTELTEHLYDQDFDRDSNVIEVFIGRLRKKIDPDNSLKPIVTVRGQGYRFTLQETDEHA
ncbi:response regulator transcription factor [Dasania marina]|uniref:response regulator transcription factor n=1 Tax=Dasania marina TaxID=471499 RepID=UPI0030D8C722|tara:strand:- start:1422 stop:2111 length:690 start_codon:yes stop_codon:yes gene_type:complete